jgi:hypothetical protein
MHLDGLKVTVTGRTFKQMYESLGNKASYALNPLNNAYWNTSRHFSQQDQYSYQSLRRNLESDLESVDLNHDQHLLRRRKQQMPN